MLTKFRKKKLELELIIGLHFGANMSGDMSTQ
jgi:hypothetical protein